MSSRPRAAVFGFLSVVLTIGLTPVLAQTPEGVSPGAVDRISDVEGRCPTFIWGGVPGAAAYELVVYRLTEGPQASNAEVIDLSESDEVLYARVPGGATAWQPELADGLEPDGKYVWFVRAVLREEAGEIVEAGDWSEPRFFSIPAVPSSMEVEAALDVLRRYTDLGGAQVSEIDEQPEADQSHRSVRSAPHRLTTPSPESLKSVPTATAAIKGSIPDFTGEVYGVVGISNSPDGAGVAAANLNGGPDLVLDGTEDDETDLAVYQWGIDRASSDDETFTLINSIGGPFALVVQGNVIATALIGDGAAITNVDADTLDGTDGAAFATDVEAAALVAVHASSADHDGRYYTETELNTSGAGGAVHWNNLTAMPAGFADGVDDDTVSSYGPGLIIDNGEIRIDSAAFSTRLSTLDSVGDVGRHSSIAISANGLGLISYYDNTNTTLNVAHCYDTVCSSASTALLDIAGDVGRYTSIAIGADGLGLISYFDNTNLALKVAHCYDTACSSSAIVFVDNVGVVGQHTSIAIGADGLGLISYHDYTNGDLKVAHCNNTACVGAAKTTLDSGDFVGSHTSIAIGADDLGLISYYDVTNNDLKVAHCNDIACSSATTTTLDSGGIVGRYTSIAIGADGLGLISYHDETNTALKVAHCNNTTCSSATTTILDSGGHVGYSTSIAIGADGLGLISYQDDTNTDLKAARCADTSCSSATTATLHSGGHVGLHTSIAIGTDGLGLISYWDQTNGDLKAAHLGIGVP